jgi:hypothetical protein
MKLDSKEVLWTGRVLSALPALALIASAMGKFASGPQVQEGFTHLGLPVELRVPIAVLELAVAVIYAIPQTSVFGAILFAGYMGGAIVTHLRMGEPFIVQGLIAVVAWAGLWLREPRLRAVLPWRG